MATAPMNTADYFSRYFPVSVSGGTTQPATGLTDVSGQVSLADILANIQGQYAPLTFTQSGGSYGAGRFIGDFGQPTGAGSVGGGTTGGGGIVQPTFQPGEFDINAYTTALPEELVKEIAAGTVYSGGDSTGGTGGDGTPGGQGVSNTGINAALNAKAILDPLGNASLLAKIAGYGVDKYLDSQIDAISEGFDVIRGNDVVDSGMYTIVDKEGNVRTISNDDSIAAQNAGIFGTQPGASTADPSPVELGMTPSPAEGGSMLLSDAENSQVTSEIIDLYQNTLGRIPDRDEVAYWKSVYDENLANNFAIAAQPEVATQVSQPETVYDARLDQSSTEYDPAFYNRVTAGLSGSGGTVGSGNISGGFVPVGLLNTGVVVGGPITGGLSQTTPLGPLSGGNSSLTSGWTSSDWSRDYTSEFGG